MPEPVGRAAGISFRARRGAAGADRLGRDSAGDYLDRIALRQRDVNPRQTFREGERRLLGVPPEGVSTVAGAAEL